VSAGASGSASGMTEEEEVVDEEAEGSAEEEEEEVDEAAIGEADEKDVGTAGGVLVVVVAMPAFEEASDGNDTLGFVL
jgi:hypothetical protein